MNEKPYRLDVNCNSGGLLTYINENIPSRELKSYSTASDIQAIVIELNIRKAKWLVISIYRPPRQNISYFLE